MTESRGRTAIVSMAVLSACVLTLALPVAAQVTNGKAAHVYEQVRQASWLSRVVSAHGISVPEPLGLAMFGFALAVSARIARRRLPS